MSISASHLPLLDYAGVLQCKSLVFVNVTVLAPRLKYLTHVVFQVWDFCFSYVATTWNDSFRASSDPNILRLQWVLSTPLILSTPILAVSPMPALCGNDNYRMPLLIWYKGHLHHSGCNTWICSAGRVSQLAFCSSSYIACLADKI